MNIMACPDLHINSLTINDDGWIILAEKNNVDNDNVHITPSCQWLLNVLKLDGTSDIILQEIQDTTEVDTLRRLPHSTELPKCIIRLIADIRRMGTNKEGVSNRNQGKGLSKKKRSQRNNAARLEEQRRLRNEKEFQQQQSSELSVEEEHTEDNGVLDDVKDNNDEDSVPLELQTAAVLNSLRVLIAILRPMLDHPEKTNYDLKMNGPSLQKKGKANSFYLFSNNVYSCISEGSKREINREYQALVQLAGKKEIMSAKEYVLSLFNREIYSMSHEQVAGRCFEVTDDINLETSEKIHIALINRFENEHDEKQYMLQKSIEKLQDHLHRALSKRFNGVNLTVYGSCLSGLALEGSHDVDVSIFIPELNTLKQQFDNGRCSGDQYQKQSKRIIFRVRDSLQYYRQVEFFDLFAITRARVPVVKGSAYMQNPYTEDGHIQFDLCFLNDIAVVNSSLLREYSLFDNRVRIMMLSVKSFAKTNNLASAADGTLSSYTWNNLVLFYLQCIGMLPALQCPTMIEEHDEVDMSDRWNSINGLDTFYLSKDMVEKKGLWQPSPGANDSNLTMLLYGFFNFYTNIFPSTVTAASIRLGKITLQKTCLAAKLGKLSVEDPFEICSSHCPHDLGSHAKEDGQAKISKQLIHATKELGKLIQMPLDNEHASIVLGKLFGQPPQHHAPKHTNAPQQRRNNQKNINRNNSHAPPQRQNNNHNGNSRQHNSINRSNNGGGRHNRNGKQNQYNKNNKPGRGHNNPRSQTGQQSNNPANMNTNGTQPQTHVKPAITEEFKQQQMEKLIKQKDDKQGEKKNRSKKQRHRGGKANKTGNGAGGKEDGGGTKHTQSDKRYRQKVNAANKKKVPEDNSSEK